VALAGLALLLPPSAHALVRPHALFADNMVLQRDAAVPVWGTAAPGEHVTVAFQGQERATVAGADGTWRVALRRLKAGGPFEMTIRGADGTVTLRNVLVGEVWLCAGQSNMAWPVRDTVDSAATLTACAGRPIRLFSVPVAAATSPQRQLTATWQVAAPEAVQAFSAVGYRFGCDLAAALGVPVGLVNASHGGTSVETWLPEPAIAAVPKYEDAVTRWEARWHKDLADYIVRLEKHVEELKKALREGGTVPPAPPRPGFNFIAALRPATFYNAMIAPLIPYAIRGAIWYQGESNGANAEDYLALFGALIRSWRVEWQQGAFPFLFVQIPGVGTVDDAGPQRWPELREAQLRASQTVPNTAMVVVADHYGCPGETHPKSKEIVGSRLALAARALAYGESIAYSGPIYGAATRDGSRMRLTFKHAASGLAIRGERLEGFTIAGEDRHFHSAEATIDGRRVVVWSPMVATPVAVRYAWRSCPLGNLTNHEGLPASPFRSDDFPVP
jgi:sialate O-acetylesterase